MLRLRKRYTPGTLLAVVGIAALGLGWVRLLCSWPSAAILVGGMLTPVLIQGLTRTQVLVILVVAFAVSGFVFPPISSGDDYPCGESRHR